MRHLIYFSVLSLPDERQERAYNTFLTVDIDTLSRAIAREHERERLALDGQTQEERDKFRQKIQRRLQEKKIEYSAMEMDNNVMMNDIILEVEEVEATTTENFISILKQQLSDSLQLSLSDSSPAGEEETVTTQLPVTWREEPRSLGIPRRRTGQEDYIKSSSSILAARASLVRKIHSSPSLSRREKRINIRRLMYDPRRKVRARRN